MNWPTSQDYNEAIQDPATNFADPQLQCGEAVVNAMGLPVPRSGNFADVYQFTGGDGKVWALKCFTRKVAALAERYAKIDEHLAKAKLPFTVGFKFLQRGVKVRGEWYPLLKMEWVEGFTLNDFVARNLDKPQYLHALTQMWAKLAGRLRDANMAHADLQHGNVLLVPGATPQKLGLKLIDYDGMWVPELSALHSGEVGHPNFQHPLRLKEKLYNGEVDRFPHLVIAAGLRATLIGGKALWERFDNEDNLLFREVDLREPGKSPVFKALWELNDPVLRTLTGHIALSVSQPLRKSPWLDDVLLEEGGPRLTSDQEKQVCTLLGVAPPSATTAASKPSQVEQEFNVFQFLDEEEPAQASEGKSSRPSTVNRRPKPKTPEKKSKTPYYIGGGVAAAAVIVIGIIVALRSGGKKMPPPHEVVQRKDDDKPKIPNRVVNKPKAAEPKEITKEAAKDPPAPTEPINFKEELRLALGGTHWNWGDAILELKSDGSTKHAAWENRFHLTTRWEVLDRRTAMLIVEKKDRQQNYFSILEFAEELDHFSGFDFGATQRMPAKRLVGSLRTPIDGTPVGMPAKHTKQELQQDLSGTQWEWAGGKLVLKNDGSAEFPATGGEVLTTRWEAIDGLTAILMIESGRNQDRVAILQFSDDVSEFVGYDFENQARLPVCKKLSSAVVPSPGGRRSPMVSMVAQVADRQYLFIRRDDPTLYISAEAVAKNPRELGKHASPIRAIAMVPDGSKVVAGDDEGIVRIWSIKGPISSKTLREHTVPVACCAVSPGGERAVSIGKDGMLCEWDLAGAKLVRKFQVPEARSVAYLPDGESVLIGTEAKAAGIWNLDKAVRSHDLPGHRVPVRAVCVSSQADYVWTSDVGGQIRIWQLPEYEYKGSIQYDPEGISSLALSPDGRTLVCTGQCGIVRFFNPRTGKVTGQYDGKARGNSLVFINNAQDLVVARDSGPLNIALNRGDAAAPSKIFTLLQKSEPLPVGPGGRIGFSPDGKYLSNATTESVTIFETATGKEVGQVATNSKCRDVALGPNKQLYFSTADNRFQLWDWGTGKMLKEFSFADAKLPGPTKIHGTVDPNRLLLITNSPLVITWDIDSWTMADRIQPFPEEACLHSEMFADGNRVVLQVAGPKGHRFVVWDLGKQQTALALEAVQTMIALGIKVSPNGKWVIGFGAENGTNFVWDGTTGKLANKSSLQGNGIKGNFTAGGNYFIRYLPNGTVSPIDLQKDAAIDSFTPPLRAKAIVICPETNVIATVDTDRRIRFSHIEIDSTPPAKELSIAKEKPPAIVKPKKDKIVGKWQWGPEQIRWTFIDNGSLVEHLSNGKLNSQGTWKLESPGKYSFQLRTGFSGTMTMLAARDKMKIEATDPSGKKGKVEAVKLKD